MSRHNYTQYSNKKHDEVYEEIKMELEPTETAAVDTVEEVAEVKKTFAVGKGTVANCVRLNVRSKPSADADVICVLPVKTEVTIDVDDSTDDWFAVWTAAGVKGYCMQKFVDSRL